MTMRDGIEAGAAAPHGYSGLQIGLHWAIVALILLAWPLGEGMEDALEAGLGGLPPHVLAGLAVLALTALRAALRLVRRPSAAAAPGPLGRVAGIVHGLLYALLLALPLSGMAAWIGGVEEAGDLHGALWTALALTALLHVAGALFHALVLRDGTMRRMLRPAARA